MKTLSSIFFSYTLTIVSFYGQFSMDSLDYLLTLAQVSGYADIRCAFHGHWQVRHDEQHSMALVHILTKGQCYLQIDGEQKKHLLQAGDVVFLPRSQGHILSSETNQTMPLTPIIDEKNGAFTIKKTVHGIPNTELFCARFEYETQSTLLASLPDVVFLHLDDAPLHAVVTLLQWEAQHIQVASHSALNALAQLLLTLLLRAYWQQPQSPQSGIAYALQDKRLGKLIQDILQCPEDNWSVNRLTQIAAISRAQLMRLFQSHLKCSPHVFVNRIRLQKAALLLRTSQHTVLAVALATGFGSETHLGKAFKREYGQTPKQYRLRHQQLNTSTNVVEFMI